MSNQPTLAELKARVNKLMRRGDVGTNHRRTEERENQPIRANVNDNRPILAEKNENQPIRAEKKENQLIGAKNKESMKRLICVEKTGREKEKALNASLKTRSNSADKRAHSPPPEPTPLKRNSISASTPSLSASNARTKRSIVVKGVTYDVLGTLGRGGSSTVYHVVSEQGRVFAIKTVDLTEADEYTRHTYLNEIKLLSKLQGSPHIITLQAYELQGNYLQVVMEKGDGDLQAYLRNRRSDDQNVKSYTTKFLWGEMLRCVKVIHDKKIVHSDLKPANFLFAGGGHIKLIDFGIAASIPTEQNFAWKDGVMGTLSYMSPEAIVECGGDQAHALPEQNIDDSAPKSRYKVPLKSDVWSLGCILYNMVYGRTPFQGIKSQHEKMMAITNLDFAIEFPEIDDKRLLDVMKRCLTRDVDRRASVDQLLHHPYLEDRPVDQNSHPEMEQLLDVLNSCSMTPRTKIKQMTIIASTSKANIFEESS